RKSIERFIRQKAKPNRKAGWSFHETKRAIEPGRETFRNISLMAEQSAKAHRFTLASQETIAISTGH
ncbi:MAG: hypothetical protein R3309_11645, partial [Reinekea sp.]|nr:hypothetical protein [Reinekea sp.]